MTVSTMRCCRKPTEALIALLLTLFVALLAAPVVAAEIDVRNIQLAANDEGGFSLNADFTIDFSPRLEEAVSKGLALHFLAEFELSRPRWYWFDEKVVKTSQTWRLTYHALTRQYRLSTGTLHQSFSTLDEALRVLSRIRNWAVIERERLASGESFEAALRFRLDMTQLPKPFQLEALSNRDWVLGSDWKRWAFVVSPSPPVPPVSVPATATGTAEAK